MSQRADKVGEELRKIISRMLIEDLNDPGLGFVTITRIELTDDLRFAKVFYSVLGSPEQKKSTQEALQRHLPLIRRMVVERINMKYAMTIKFEADASIDHSFEIDSILKKIKEQEGREDRPA